LRRYARLAQGSGSAKTFVALDEANVAGYYSLTVGQVDALEAPERIRHGMGGYPIPVVLLARLAVDRRYQGQGIGAGLLQDAIRRALVIAEQAGIRALLTHPLDEDARRFYLGFGFMPRCCATIRFCSCSRMPGGGSGRRVKRMAMPGRTSRWLVSRIDRSRPYYLLGEVEIADGRGPALAGRLDSVETYNPASYRGGILCLHYARAAELGPWLDLVAARGEVVVQFWLKPGEAAVTLGRGRNGGRNGYWHS